MEISGQRVVVVGLGRSGRAAASLAHARGAQVVAVDARADVAPIEGVELELGPHRRDTFLSADLLVLSPGVPATQPDVVAAAAAGVHVVGELGFAASFLDLPTVAVTGTNGKSTVVSFVGQLMEACGWRPFVGGNLGNALSNAVLDGPDAYDALVVEVSSYQLEWPGDLSPDVGVILNLTPDHLARHGDMDTYGRCKVELFARMGPKDLALLPAGDDRLRRLAQGVGAGARGWLGAHPGVVRRGARAELVLPEAHGGASMSLDLTGLRVPGDHNRDNAAVGALAALALGVEPGALQAAIPALRALEHRMQVVAERDGVVWINDSKATNVDAARVGIAGLDRRAVVLLGGEPKGGGFDALVEPCRRHRAVVCFGQAAEQIAGDLARGGVACRRCDRLQDAVSAARALALPGDAVLLSPACASFDEFIDFEHRGRVFAALASGRTP